MLNAHDKKPFLVHRSGETLSPIATWEACALEDLLQEPHPLDAPGPWLASVYQRLVVASAGPVAVGRTSARLDRAGWFHAAVGADLDAARAGCWPALEAAKKLALGVGSLAPKLVLVGENAPKDQLPFHSRSGHWLWLGLRALGWDELTCYVTNARNPNRRPQVSELKQLHAALDRYQPLWVALGQTPSMVLSGAGIVHVAVDHPQYHARAHRPAGPEGYAAHLESKGVPSGPWKGQKLPTVEKEGVPPLSQRLGLAPTVAYSPQPGTRKRRGGKNVQTARQYFVLGVGPNKEKVDTLAEAARLADASYEWCGRVARAEDWFQERENHHAKTFEKAKEKASDLEAQKIASCRSLSWTATMLGLKSVVTRLGPEGDLAKEIDPRQVHALGRLALEISSLGDPATSEELKRVQKLGASELLNEYKKTLEAFGVEGEKA